MGSDASTTEFTRCDKTERQHLRIIFRKGDGARFLSHLDLMATFEYSVRRAGLPVELSEGFTPRPRMSAAAPLALGYIGEQEILDLVLRERLPSDEVRRRLQAALPGGIVILSVETLPDGEKHSAAKLCSADYTVALPYPVPDLTHRVAILLDHTRLDVEERRERRVRRRDLRPLILELVASNPDTLHMRIRLDGDGTARPEQLLELLKIPADGARITRERIELTD